MISGTPPIVGMLPMRDMLDLLDEAGMPEVRAKSTALTGFVIDVADAYLPGVRVVSPRDPERRGSHVMLDHPDFRPPQGLRVGLSPLSTSFTEVAVGLWVIRELLG